MLAEISPLLLLRLVLSAVRVLNSRKLEDVLKCLLGFFPVFLFDLNLTLHEHENRVITDAEVLSKGLLEEVVSSAHVASLTVDDSGEDVCLDHSRILREAVVDLAESARRVVEEPARLSKQDLGLGKCRVLLGDILE